MIFCLFYFLCCQPVYTAVGIWFDRQFSFSNEKWFRTLLLTQGVDQRNLRNNQVIVCVTLIWISQVVRVNHGLRQWWRGAVYVDATPWQTDKHTALHSQTQRQVHADSLPSLHTHRFVLLKSPSVTVLLLQDVTCRGICVFYYVVMLLYMWW